LGEVTPQANAQLASLLSSSLTRFTIFLLAVLLDRAATFGNPLIHIDEGFYLLVGDRMLHGAIPYADIWDRKPLGLFAVYAGIRLLGGEGIVQYQLVAALSVAATALVMSRIADRFVTQRGALLCGLAYILWLTVFGCYGGQAPVFYNLPIACAALLVVRGFDDSKAGSIQLVARGAGAMLLVGVATQLKNSAVFEGVFFGLVLLGQTWRQDRRIARLASVALFWIGCALLPIMLAVAAMARLGHSETMIAANFFSIFGRAEPWAPSLRRLALEMTALVPFWVLFWIGRPLFPQTPVARFIKTWSAVAFAAFLLFGTWHEHYVAPLLVPLCLLAARVLGAITPPARLAATFLIASGVLLGGAAIATYTRQNGNAAQLAHLADLTNTARAGGCLYLNEGDPILYQVTSACTVTRYLFPTHIASNVESRTLDQVAEMRAILSRKPAAVVIAAKPRSRDPNLVTRAMLLDALARNYRMTGTARVGKRDYQVYARTADGMP
jgi:hypothetical protein